MHLRLAGLLVATLLVPSFALAAEKPDAGKADTVKAGDWNRFTAARYLDARETWWLAWPKSQRDHETACVSCHTAVPYAMARPALRKSLGETTPSATEQSMLNFVVKRVTLWDELEPFYNDAKSGPKKTIESRGTESVLNALILARYDSAADVPMRQITRDAFAHMWSKQLQGTDEAGSWNWLNFHNAPWESDESHYWGATLAAIAVGFAPASYQHEKDVQPHLAALRTYLCAN
jgi:squalene-hopene/tetraprenyl-beta-curcumene cyclase